MKKAELTLPEIALIAGTRGMLGAGAGLLLADRLTVEQRKAIGSDQHNSAGGGGDGQEEVAKTEWARRMPSAAFRKHFQGIGTWRRSACFRERRTCRIF